MITRNPMQLKAFIKKKGSREKYFCTTCHAELHVGEAAGKNFSVNI